jgi:hypothetical protein
MAKFLAQMAIHKIAEEMVRLGMLPAEAPNNIERIIIDLKSGEIAVVYIRMFGEDSIVLDGLPDLLRFMFGKEEDAAVQQHQGDAEIQRSDTRSANPDPA